MPLHINPSLPKENTPRSHEGQAIDAAETLLRTTLPQGFRATNHDHSPSAGAELYSKAEMQRFRDEDIETTNERITTARTIRRSLIIGTGVAVGAFSGTAALTVFDASGFASQLFGIVTGLIAAEMYRFHSKSKISVDRGFHKYNIDPDKFTADRFSYAHHAHYSGSQENGTRLTPNQIFNYYQDSLASARVSSVKGAYGAIELIRENPAQLWRVDHLEKLLKGLKRHKLNHLKVGTVAGRIFLSEADSLSDSPEKTNLMQKFPEVTKDFFPRGSKEESTAAQMLLKYALERSPVEAVPLLRDFLVATTPSKDPAIEKALIEQLSQLIGVRRFREIQEATSALTLSKDSIRALLKSLDENEMVSHLGSEDRDAAQKLRGKLSKVLEWDQHTLV